MFNVEFFTFSKKQNSTARPARAGTVIPCIANTDFNILSPSICLNLNTYPGNYNYCYIPEFGRYYYCTFRFDAQTGLWWADCQVDALATWKPQIGALSEYVLRAAADSDGLIVDNEYPTVAPTVMRTAISSPWIGGTYVVSVVGKQSVTNYFAMTGAEFYNFISYIFGDTFFNDVRDGVVSVVKSMFNPIQYITSVRWFPIDPTGTTNTNIWLGYWDTGITGHLITSKYLTWSSILVFADHPQAATRGRFLNNNPFTSRIINAPPFGTLVVPMSFFMPGTPGIGETGPIPYLDMTVDFVSGEGILTLRNDRDSNGDHGICATAQATIGIPLQLSQVTNNIGGAVTSVISTVMAAESGNYVGAAAGIGSAINNLMPTVQITGLNAGFASIWYASWEVMTTYHNLVPEDNANRGRPLCQVRTLSSLPGYQLVGDIHVEIPCTEQEKNTITATLTGGYYFE